MEIIVYMVGLLTFYWWGYSHGKVTGRLDLQIEQMRERLAELNEQYDKNLRGDVNKPD